jgi:hypothetical protein
MWSSRPIHRASPAVVQPTEAGLRQALADAAAAGVKPWVTRVMATSLLEKERRQDSIARPSRISRLA